MISFKLPDDALNKALCDLAINDIKESLSKIGWDMSMFAGPLKVTLRSDLGPDYKLSLFASIKVQSAAKLVTVEDVVSHMALLTVGDSSEQAKLISMHMRTMAHEMVGGILKEYGTSYAEESKRRYEALKKQAENPNYIFPNFPIISDPTLPPGTMKLVSPNGEVVMKIKEETVKEAIDDRKKNAKWKID